MKWISPHYGILECGCRVGADMQLFEKCPAHMGDGPVRLVATKNGEISDAHGYEDQASQPLLPVGETWREYYEGCAGNARFLGIEVSPYNPQWNEFQLHSAVSEIDVRCEEVRANFSSILNAHRVRDD